MTNTSVQYHFSELKWFWEDFKAGNHNLESPDRYISTNLCFARYFRERELTRVDLKDRDVFYVLHAVPINLYKMVEYINEHANGVKVDIIASKPIDDEASCFFYKLNTLDTSLDVIKFRPAINKAGYILKSPLELSKNDHKIAVRISIKNREDSYISTILEYICLTFIRLVDNRENFISKSKYADWEGDIYKEPYEIFVKNMLAADRKVNNGHSLVTKDNGFGFDANKFNVKILSHAFDIDFIKKFRNLNSFDGSLLIRQTKIFSMLTDVVNGTDLTKMLPQLLPW